MFKPMTLSLGLAMALIATGAAKADGLIQKSDCASCAANSGVMPSAQGLSWGAPVISPSPQMIGGCTDACTPACPTPSCGPKLSCKMPSLCLPKLSMPKICLPQLPKIQCPQWHLEKFAVTKTRYRLVRSAPACQPTCAPSVGMPIAAPSCNNCGSCDSCTNGSVGAWSNSPAWSAPAPAPLYTGSYSSAAPAYSAAPGYAAAPAYSAAPTYAAAPTAGAVMAAPAMAAPAAGPIQSTPAAAAAPAPAPAPMTPAAPEIPKAAVSPEVNKTSSALILDPVSAK